jgi:hypothetical protein
MGSQESKRPFIKKISFIIRHRGDLGQLKSDSDAKLFIEDGIAITLIDQTARLYTEVLEGLSQFHNWSDRFSERYLDKELQKLIANAAKEEANERTIEGCVSHFFNELVDRLDSYSAENIVIVPIAGFRSDPAPSDARVTIGNLTLMYMNDTRIRETIDVLENIRAKAPKKAPKQEQLVDMLRQNSLDRIKGQVCAEYRVVAEPERAIERAYDETRRSLDWLRCATFFLYSREKGKKMAAGLGPLGEVITYTPETALIMSSSSTRITLRNAAKGPLFRFDWNAENIRSLRESGFLRMAELLKCPVLTDFQQALLLGVHWFADSLTQLQKENELLSLITCLESVIPSKDKFDKRSTEGGISHAIAESVATAYAANLPPKQKNRDRIRGAAEKLVLDMYGKRSHITHGGKIEIFDRELGELSLLVGGLINWLIQQYQSEEFLDQLAFLKWLQFHKSKFDYERLEKEFRAAKKSN